MTPSQGREILSPLKRNLLEIKIMSIKILKLKIECLEEIIACDLDTDDTFYAMMQFCKIELDNLERGLVA